MLQERVLSYLEDIITQMHQEDTNRLQLLITEPDI